MPVDVPLNTWFHVSASYDAMKRELRLVYYSPGDGSNQETTPIMLTGTKENVPPLKGESTLLQMGNPDLERKALNGALSEFRVWNYARTVEETTEQRSDVVLPADTDGRLTYRYGSSARYTNTTETAYLQLQQPPPNASTTNWLGPKDFINVGTHGDLNLIGESFTFETWVNVEKLATEGAPYADNNIFSSEYAGAGGTAGLVLRHHQGSGEPPGIVWSFWGYNIQMPVDVPLNTWFHVSASYDAMKRELRLVYYSPGDGSNQETTPIMLTGTKENVPPLKGESTLLQMGNPDLERKALNGALSEFRVWNYARTVDETTEQRSDIVLPADTDGRLTYRFVGSS